MTTSSNSDLVSLFTESDIQYRDFDLRMNFHPVNNNLVTLKDENAVKRAIYNLLMTSPGERPFNQYFGVPLVSTLFELDSINTLTVHNMINNAIEYYEPRIRVNSIKVEMNRDQGELSIFLDFTIHRLKKDATLDIFIRRTK